MLRRLADRALPGAEGARVEDDHALPGLPDGSSLGGRTDPAGLHLPSLRLGRSRAFRTQKGESRTPACFGLTEPLRGFQGARRGLELRAPAELIAPTAEAEAEPFAPKKEKLAPLPVLALTELFQGFPGARRGLELRAPAQLNRADSRHPGLTEGTTPVGPLWSPSRHVANRQKPSLSHPKRRFSHPRLFLA